MGKILKKCYKNYIDNFAMTSISVFILLYILYVLVMRENIVMPMHDNLDSNVVWFKLLKDNNAFFTYGKTYLPFLGGFDRNLMSTNLDVYTWFYILLPVFYASIFASIFRIIVSVFGMIALFREILGVEEYSKVKNVIPYLGLSFGIFPVFLSGQFGIAFLPIFILCFIKFYKTRDLRWAIGVISYAFCSHIILYGIFVCAYFLLFVIYDCVNKKKFNIQLFILFIIFCVSVICSQWRLFMYQMQGEESIRTAFKSDELVIKHDLLKTLVNVFFKGNEQAGELYTYFIVPLTLIGLLFLIFQTIKGKNVLYLGEIVVLVIMCIFNAVMYALDTKSNLIYLIVKNISESLATIQCSRFQYLSPALWYIAFGLVIVNVIDIFKKKGIYIAYVMVLASVFIMFVKPATYNLVQQNIKHIQNVIGGNDNDVTVRRFYAKDMFDEIKKDIDYNGEWAVAYGFHPAVLEYNKIATLDGYNSVYSKAYKDKFRKLITPYEKAGGNLAYFDSWGGRAYIFGDVNYLSYYDKEPAALYIDPDVFKDMNGEYVISRVEVTNPDENRLEFVKEYTDYNTAYEHMFVYRIK